MRDKRRLLIVEDERAILQGLVDVFVYHGFAVDQATDGVEGLRRAEAGPYDLILLDVMLPGMDGYAVCERIRARSRRQPIILLTARSTEEDILAGLSLGADDYITKPFSVRELVLRVESVLRRAGPPRGSGITLRLADGCHIDADNLAGQHPDGSEIAFTQREMEVLLYLAGQGERIVPREELLEAVWGYRKGDEIETRTVDIHIAKLRKKIEADPKEPVHLLTVRGRGYRLLAATEG
jgi:two-component system response regulator RegX3